jgi:hypothetical protein
VVTVDACTSPHECLHGPAQPSTTESYGEASRPRLEGDIKGAELAPMVVIIYPSPVDVTPGSPDRDAKSRGGNVRVVWLAVVAGAVLLTLGGVIGVGRWVDDEPEPAGLGAQSRQQLFQCMVELPPSGQPDPADLAQCNREGDDFARRAPMRDGQPPEAMVEAVQRAASSGGWCMGHITRACLTEPSSHRPGPQDVDVARRLLARTGASDTTARLARPDDPAPAGTLLYAARVGDTCIIGYVGAIPSNGGPIRFGGLLPDGKCLPD